MRNVAVLSHIADIDGVGSAALVKMRYRIPLGNIFLTNHDLDEISRCTSAIARMSRKGFTLFITDLNPSAGSARVYERLVKRVKGRGGRVVWLDHHVWKQEAINRIARKCDIAVFGENSEMCATQLVHKFLGLNTGFANEFADMVHYIDLFLPTNNRKYKKRAEEYKLGIDYYLISGSHDAQQSRLRHLAGVVSSGRFADSNLRTAAKNFKDLNSRRIKELLSGLFHLSNRVVLGFSKQVDSNDACEAMLTNTHADVSILIKTDTGHCSIRSRKSDTVPLANALGGGGHPHASGFSVDVKKHKLFSTLAEKKKFVARIRRVSYSAGLL